MPVILSTNRLLTWAAGIFASYWALGFILESLLFSTIVSATLFVSGFMVSVRAVPDAVQIIKRDQLGAGELAVIGLALIATGAVVSGLGNALYAYHGRPEAWIGPMLAFGRGMIATGFFVLFLSPDTTNEGVKWPRWYWLFSGAVVIFVIAFIIGYTFRPASELGVPLTGAMSR